jgi:hypothetical protein
MRFRPRAGPPSRRKLVMPKAGGTGQPWSDDSDSRSRTAADNHREKDAAPCATIGMRRSIAGPAPYLRMKFDSTPNALAWEFMYTEGGIFRRNKAAFAHHGYPKLGPAPRPARSSRACSRERDLGVPAQAHIE